MFSRIVGLIRCGVASAKVGRQMEFFDMQLRGIWIMVTITIIRTEPAGKVWGAFGKRH